MKVTLNRQSELPAQTGDFAQSDGAVLGEAKAKVAEAPEDVLVVRVNGGDEPGAASVRREQFDHGPRVELVGDYGAPETVALQFVDVLR